VSCFKYVLLRNRAYSGWLLVTAQQARYRLRKIISSDPNYIFVQKTSSLDFHFPFFLSFSTFHTSFLLIPLPPLLPPSFLYFSLTCPLRFLSQILPSTSSQLSFLFFLSFLQFYIFFHFLPTSFILTSLSFYFYLNHSFILSLLPSTFHSFLYSV
jgi:hypothetical protein